MVDDNSQKNDRLATRVMVLTIGRVLGTASIIFLFVILSRLLSTSQYGSFRQVWMLNKGLIDIFQFGIPLSVYYFLPKVVGRERSGLIVQTVLLMLVLGSVASALIFIFAEQISIFFNNPELSTLLRLFCLYPLFAMPMIALQSILVSLNKSVYFSIFTIIDRVLLTSLAATVIFIYRDLEILFGVLVVFAFFEFLAVLYVVYSQAQEFQWTSSQIRITEQIAFAIPSGLSNLADVANVEIDKWMVSLSFSVSQFAYYANGAIEIPFLGTIVDSVTSVLMPEYVKKNHAGDNLGILDLWHTSIRKVSLLFIPLVVFLCIFANDFIVFMFSEKYQASSPIFQLYVIAILPKMTWYGNLLLAMGYSREPFKGSLLALIVNIVFNYAFIRWIGFWGPAIASVLTSYIVAGYFLSRIRSVLGISWSAVYPWAYIAQVLGITCLIGIVISPITQLDGLSGFFTLLVGGIAFSVLSFFTLRFAGLIGDEDVELLWKFVVRAKKILSPK